MRLSEVKVGWMRHRKEGHHCLCLISSNKNLHIFLLAILNDFWLRLTTGGRCWFCISKALEIWMSKQPFSTSVSKILKYNDDASMKNVVFLRTTNPCWYFQRGHEAAELWEHSGILSAPQVPHSAAARAAKIFITHPATHNDLSTKRKGKKKLNENQFVLAAGWFSKAANLRSTGERGKAKLETILLSDHLNITSSPHPPSHPTKAGWMTVALQSDTWKCGDQCQWEQWNKGNWKKKRREKLTLMLQAMQTHAIRWLIQIGLCLPKPLGPDGNLKQEWLIS